MFAELVLVKSTLNHIVAECPLKFSHVLIDWVSATLFLLIISLLLHKTFTSVAHIMSWPTNYWNCWHFWPISMAVVTTNPALVSLIPGNVQLGWSRDDIKRKWIKKKTDKSHYSSRNLEYLTNQFHVENILAHIKNHHQKSISCDKLPISNTFSFSKFHTSKMKWKVSLELKILSILF